MKYHRNEWADFVHIWYSINHNRDWMKVHYIFALWQIIAFMSIISDILYICSDMNQWILFMLGTVINHHRGFCTYNVLWLCAKIGCNYAYFVITLVYLCDISHMNSYVLFIFDIVTIYYNSLMHVRSRSKFTPCQTKAKLSQFCSIKFTFVINPH